MNLGKKLKVLGRRIEAVRWIQLDEKTASAGLLSNEIFGITQADRAGIFAYIDLVEYFIDSSCYKALTRIDKNLLRLYMLQNDLR